MKISIVQAAMCGALLTAACGSDTTEPMDEPEEITTVTLSFQPSSGAPVVAVWDDADGAGGADPTVDSITLTEGAEYALSITLTNKLETPAEDITAEVMEEADEHQLFLTGSVMGPASDTSGALLVQAYADSDADGLPLGLSHTITATMAGTAALQVTLRHLPAINDAAQKVAGLDDTVKSGGISALPGESDVSISFDLVVQ